MKRILIFVLFAGTVFAQSGQEKKPMEFCTAGDTNCTIFIGPLTTAEQLYDSTAVLVTAARGPSLEIITRDHGKPAELVRIKDADGKMLLTVHLDGSVSTDNGYKADDAAKSFWRALAAYYRPVCDQMYPPADQEKK